jgi:hypothetical protein
MSDIKVSIEDAQPINVSLGDAVNVIGGVKSVNGRDGDVLLSKLDVGLESADNTSDANKPVSIAQQTALDGKVAKAGDTMSGSLQIDDPSSERSLDITSNNSGGLNASDSTGRINLHSHQKAQLNNDSNTNQQQAHYGEVIRIDMEHQQAKGVVAFRENYLGAEEGARTVAWLVAHGEANDSTPGSPSWHNHFSIELPDENGALQTSLEFPFAPFNQPNAFGMPTGDRYVRSVVALLAAADIYVESNSGINRNIYFSSKRYKDATGKRWGVQADNTAESGTNTGSDFRINSYDDAGAFVRTPLFIKRSSGLVGLGTSSPTRALDINADTIRLRTANTPANASATGEAGCIRWDANYVYVCVATNTWKRAALSSW